MTANVCSCGHPKDVHSFQHGCEGLGDWTQPIACGCTDYQEAS